MARRLGVRALILRTVQQTIPSCAHTPIHKLKAEIDGWSAEKRGYVRQLVREKLDLGPHGK